MMLCSMPMQLGVCLVSGMSETFLQSSDCSLRFGKLHWSFTPLRRIMKVRSVAVEPIQILSQQN